MFRRERIFSRRENCSEVRTVQTNSFGYYRFENVRAGEIYIFQVNAKRYPAMSPIVTVGEEMTELNLTVGD